MTFEDYAGAARPWLLRVAVLLSADRALAEDLVQSVLMKAYQQWDRVRASDVPDAYIRRMLVNEFLSWRRRFARADVTETIDHLLPSDPDIAVAYAQRADLLAQVLRLPPKQRATVVLSYYEDLNDTDIAAILGCEPSTVRSNLSRALAALNIAITAENAQSKGVPHAPHRG